MVVLERFKSFVVNLVLFLFISSLCLFVLEVIYLHVKDVPLDGSIPLEDNSASAERIFRKSLNDVLGHELNPDTSAIYKGTNFTINSFGMRDKQYSLEKPEGVYRIAVLGDSIIWCGGCGSVSYRIFSNH